MKSEQENVVISNHHEKKKKYDDNDDDDKEFVIEYIHVSDITTSQRTPPPTPTSSSTTTTTTTAIPIPVPTSKRKISTGIGFLDHMIDQFQSHAQISIAITVGRHDKTISTTTSVTNSNNDNHTNVDVDSYSFINRYSGCVGTVARDGKQQQYQLLRLVGDAIGRELKKLLLFSSVEKNNTSSTNASTATNHSMKSLSSSSRFACPLDEALTVCEIEVEVAVETTPLNNVDYSNNNNNNNNNSNNNHQNSTSFGDELILYTLEPYGSYHRCRVGTLYTRAIKGFWQSLVSAVLVPSNTNTTNTTNSNMVQMKLKLKKVRGTNAHHIIESSFKAFCRAYRNLIDGIDTKQSNVVMLVTPSSSASLSITENSSNNNDNNDNNHNNNNNTGIIIKRKIIPESVHVNGYYNSHEYDFGSNNYNTSVYTTTSNSNSVLDKLYGPTSANWNASIGMNRSCSISRKTKETSIEIKLKFDGGDDNNNTTTNTTTKISTGILMLDTFLSYFAKAACISISVECIGDLYIDEHHTAEDVAISIGQAINTALTEKGGLTRMWTSTVTIVIENHCNEQQNTNSNSTDNNATTYNYSDTAGSNSHDDSNHLPVSKKHKVTIETRKGNGNNDITNHDNITSTIEVTMDLSNRPQLTSNLDLIVPLPVQLQSSSLSSSNPSDIQSPESAIIIQEKVQDLSLEMFEHVLESLVVHARMTVHIVHTPSPSPTLAALALPEPTIIETSPTDASSKLENIIIATAIGLGQCLKYCTIVDVRRAGQTASSKGTLSV